MNVRLMMVHAGCIALIAACLGLAATVLKGQPEAQNILVGAAVLLWGKLGFTPDRALVEKIVQQLPPVEVVRIRSMAPPSKATQSPTPTLTVVPPVEPPAVPGAPTEDRG